MIFLNLFENIVGTLYLQSLHLQIRPTTDQNYLEKTVAHVYCMVKPTMVASVFNMDRLLFLFKQYNYIHSIYIVVSIISNV